jgi:phosphoglycolate phosphatase-like HAD superfamily hydrolase
VKAVGGTAIGVATDEAECLRADAWKRDRLARAGADWVIPNFLRLDELLGRLFSN